MTQHYQLKHIVQLIFLFNKEGWGVTYKWKEKKVEKNNEQICQRTLWKIIF